jgi:DNA primase
MHFAVAKSRCLYNFHKAIEHAKDEIIVVESIGNTMRWHDAGFKNVVASLGCKLSNFQCRLLISSSKRVIIAYDGDEAGRNGAKYSVAKLEQFVDTIAIFPPDERDWAEMSNQEVNDIYLQAKSIQA